MGTKGNLSVLITRTKLQLKSIRLLVWLPIITINIVFPALVLFDYFRFIEQPSFFEERVRILGWMILPVSTIWWSVFAWKECMEANGNELLFLYGNRIKLWDGLRLWLFLLLNMSVVYCVILLVLPQLKLLFIWLLLTSLFYFALSYFISFVSKSTTITLMTCLVYHLANLTVPMTNPIPLLFYSANGHGADEFTMVFLPMCMMSVILIALGLIFNHKALKFR
jgi:hypothetical protein